MQIQSTLLGDYLTIIIDGHITGIKEFSEIKAIIDSHTQAKAVELKINDAHVIPSMLIGYLVKIIKMDKKKVTIKCSKKELKSLITDLNLHTIINVR